MSRVERGSSASVTQQVRSLDREMLRGARAREGRWEEMKVGNCECRSVEGAVSCRDY